MISTLVVCFAVLNGAAADFGVDDKNFKVEAPKLEACPDAHPCQCGASCCNKSPFAGDDRCVCGPHAEDWKTPAQCGPDPAPQPNPQGQCTQTAVGQKSVFIPGGCSGNGCYDGNCGFCVYDMPACVNAYGKTACQDTDNSRKAEGFNGCDKNFKVEAPKLEACPDAHPCQCGASCCNKSPFAGDDRCVCGPHAEDWKTPAQCGKDPAPQPKPQGQCTQTAVGQKSVFIPGGCSGTGCYDGNCGFCVYDMPACVNAYGKTACQDTDNSRKAEGFNGCGPKLETSGIMV